MTAKAPLPSLRELLAWPPGQAPWDKQEAAHQASSAERVYALLLEQRCGKTIVVLGTCAYQYSRFLEAGGFGKREAPPGKKPPSPEPGGVLDLLPKRFREGTPGKRPGTFIRPRIDDLPKAPALDFIYRPKAWASKGMDALVVIAMPSGVPPNWAEEIALRFPASMRAKFLVWDSKKADGADYAEAFRDLVAHEGFACLLMNGEAIPTAAAKKALGTFLRARRAVTVGDETSLICSQPGNVRSHVMEAIRKLPGAVCRRILDGTPGDESPLDMYAQVRFLDWKILGHDSWTAFKAFYASWEVNEIWLKNPKTGKPEPKAIRQQAVDPATGKKVFANLDVMARKLAPHSFRVRRTECFDIPEKVRVPYRFDLSEAQRGVYDPLREEFEAWLADGTRVTAKHALARMTRLDQITANYYPPVTVPSICGDCDGEGCAACGDVGALMVKTAKKVIDAKKNSRIDALADVLSLNKGDPMIAWCVFDETVDAAIALGEKLGLAPLRYDGKVDDDEKQANKLAFAAGKSGLFVSKESSGGRGLNLSAAKAMVYVENGYSKRKRSQSEDRAEVAGRTFGTGIYDLIANDTYDEKKLAAHFAKGEVSDAVWRELREAWAT